MNTKTTLRRIATLALGSSLASGAALYANYNPDERIGADEHAKLRQDGRALDQMSRQSSDISLQQGEIKLEQALGATVRSSDGEELGTIADFAVDPQQNQIQFALISPKDEAGSKRAIIPIRQLSQEEVNLHDEAGGIAAHQSGFTAEISQSEFENAPTIDMNEGDLADALQRSIAEVNDAFDSDIPQTQVSSAEYNLATEFQDAELQLEAQAGQKAQVDSVVLDLQDQGNIALIVSNDSGQQFRVSASEAELSDTQMIESSSAQYSSSETGYYSTRPDQPEQRSPQASSEFDASRESDMRSSDSGYASSDVDSSSDWESSASVSQSSSDSDSSADAQAGTDKARSPDQVYSSNGLVDDSEEASQRSGQSESSMASSDDSYAVIEDEEQDISSSSAKYDWDSASASNTLGVSAPAQLLGLTVKDSEGDTVGEVDDVVLRQDTGAPAFAIVETDSWFNAKAAIVPLQSLQPESDEAIGQSSQQASAQKLEALKISMTEDQFDQLANFSDSDDLESYLQENRDRLAQEFGVSKDQLPDGSVSIERLSESRRSQSSSSM